MKAAHFRNISKAGQYADTTLITDFQYSLGNRYQMVLGTIASYINQQPFTGATVASQQYYYYPVGLQTVDTVSITIGSVQYPCTVIYDQRAWNVLNALQIQPTAIPQFIFPRKSDFGIWPIPQDVYTINFYGFQRDRNMMVDDYTTGTISVAPGSTTVTGSGTTFTPAMVGRWFEVIDTTVPGQGYGYRIASYISDTVVDMETYWAGSSASGATYRIGEVPEIPVEAQALLPYGTASDYYSGMRNDGDNSLRFDNMYWSGSQNQNSRDFGDKNIKGGLIGLYNSYASRNRDVIVNRQPPIISPSYKIWSESIS